MKVGRLFTGFLLGAAVSGTALAARSWFRIDGLEARLASLESRRPVSPAREEISSPAVPAPDPLRPAEERLNLLLRRLAASPPTSSGPASDAADAPPLLIPSRDELKAILREEYVAARHRVLERKASENGEDPSAEGDVFLRDLLGTTDEQAREIMQRFSNFEERSDEAAKPYIEDYAKWGRIDTDGLVRVLEHERDGMMREITRKLTPEQASRFTDFMEIVSSETRYQELSDGKLLEIKRDGNSFRVGVVASNEEKSGQ